MHSLAKEWSFFDEIDDGKATNPFTFNFATKKEPIIVTVGIDIILQHQIIL
jgi:hypothetical protein